MRDNYGGVDGVLTGLRVFFILVGILSGILWIALELGYFTP